MDPINQEKANDNLGNENTGNTEPMYQQNRQSQIGNRLQNRKKFILIKNAAGSFERIDIRAHELQIEITRDQINQSYPETDIPHPATK